MRTIRLRAQALRPVLISAKITREIKQSKAEAGRRMLCGHGEYPRAQPVRRAHSPAPSAVRSVRLNPGRGALLRSGCEAEEGARIRRPPTDA